MIIHSLYYIRVISDVYILEAQVHSLSKSDSLQKANPSERLLTEFKKRNKKTPRYLGGKENLAATKCRKVLRSYLVLIPQYFATFCRQFFFSPRYLGVFFIWRWLVFLLFWDKKTSRSLWLTVSLTMFLLLTILISQHLLLLELSCFSQ